MKFTDEEIKAMAREAGIQSRLNTPTEWWCWEGSLERFATLVADAEAKRIHDEGMVTVGHMREKIEAERKRADALAATVAALRDVVTTSAETKEEFVSRVRAVLGEDPDARVLGAVLAERERCAKLCEDARASIWEYHPDEVKQAAKNTCANLAAAIRALK